MKKIACLKYEMELERKIAEWIITYDVDKFKC